MIYYDQWLSKDTEVTAAQSRHNEAIAARIYAQLKPLRLICGAIGAWGGPVWQSWRANRQWKLGVRELADLDDRLLHDIGLTRDQVAELARSSLAHDGQHRLAVRGGRPILSWSKRDKKQSCDVIPLHGVRRGRDVRSRKGLAPKPVGSLDAA